MVPSILLKALVLISPLVRWVGWLAQDVSRTFTTGRCGTTLRYVKSLDNRMLEIQG
jgi:hypothetical protein